MLDNPIGRRAVTIPAVVIAFALAAVLLPLLLVIAALVDTTRWLASRKPAMSLRILCFGFGYLAGEVWALAAMAWVGLRGEERSVEATYRLQQMWLDWNFDLLALMFDLRFRVSGLDQIAPGPIILLSRHASLIDTMLPGRYVGHRIRLRYVLKKELRIDPALDIGGDRLPNYFIDRRGTPAEELSGIRSLADGLGPDGVLIYPEGTRFTEEKRQRYVARASRAEGRVGTLASTYRRVLPPRPAGTLTLLESTDADVVVLAHRGLEGFAGITHLYQGGLVGSTIDVAFWRVPRSGIPVSRGDRVEWLYQVWAEVDSWVVA